LALAPKVKTGLLDFQIPAHQLAMFSRNHRLGLPCPVLRSVSWLVCPQVVWMWSGCLNRRWLAHQQICLAAARYGTVSRFNLKAVIYEATAHLLAIFAIVVRQSLQVLSVYAALLVL
jgi:hypothetical protein